MLVEVRIARIYSRLARNQETVTCELQEAATLLILFNELESAYQGLTKEILNDNHQVADHVNLYINGENVRYAEGLKTRLKNGDVVNIIPAAAAG